MEITLADIIENTVYPSPVSLPAGLTVEAAAMQLHKSRTTMHAAPVYGPGDGTLGVLGLPDICKDSLGHLVLLCCSHRSTPSISAVSDDLPTPELCGRAHG